MSLADQPAFPVANGQVQYGANGMTLRQHYAGLAMQGMCAYHGSYGPNNAPADIAERAVQLADALIAQLEKAP